MHQKKNIKQAKGYSAIKSAENRESMLQRLRYVLLWQKGLSAVNGMKNMGKKGRDLKKER